MAGEGSGENSAFEGHLDEICERIEGGETMSSIARSFGVHKSRLTRWVHASPERKMRVDSARVLSGEAYADLAGEVIEKAGDRFGLDKAKELAHHYRWRAKMADPDRFADRIKQDVTTRATVRVRDLTGRKPKVNE